MSTPDQPASTRLSGTAYDRRRSRASGARPAPVPFDLNDIPFDPGVYLVEASAGTGKTFSLTHTVLRLLLDRDEAGNYRVREIGNVLVVTFTNAATSELITRVRAALRDAVDVFAGAATRTEKNAPVFALYEKYGATELPRLRDALSKIDQLAIFTIHGFCKRVLDESALESGTAFDAGFIEDDSIWIERVTQDWWRRTIYENAQLASLAVSETWKYDAFVKELKQWQRWPGTRIEPEEELGAACTALETERQRFTSEWDSAHVATFLAARKWYANAPLKPVREQRRAVAAGEALAAGNYAGLWMARRCTAEALRSNKGIQKRAKDQIEQLAHEPFVLSCDRLVAAADAVYRALRVSCFGDVARRFEAEKRGRHLLGFDDLLRRLRDALMAEGEQGLLATTIRARYDAALIDEFQDTDPYQFPIFATAFAERPLFLIGDPKQAIYAFRGADIFAYRDAAASADCVYTLDQNWRSTPRMVQCVNALFGRRPNAFLYDWIDFRAVTAARNADREIIGDERGAMHWWYIPSTDGKPISKESAARCFHQALAHECVRLVTSVESGGMGIAPGSIAVLVRDSYEAKDVQRALRRVGVPSILARLGDVLTSNEVRELEAILQAVLTPQRGTAVRAALATEIWGKNAAEIHEFSREESEPAWHALIDELVTLRELWVQRGFLRMAQTFMATHGVAERLLAYEDGERRLTNLRQSIELFHTLSVEERLSPEGLLLRVARARAMKTEEAERTELRLESDADAVQIVTIHKSKGLEYDVVFCPGLWSCKRGAADAPLLIHDGKDVIFDHHPETDPVHADRWKIGEAERLAEELRLLYVALTRARRRCYVAWGPVGKGKTGAAAWDTALAYLLRPDGIDGTPEDVVARVSEAMENDTAMWEVTLREFVGASEGTMTLELVDAADRQTERWVRPSTELRTPGPRADLPNAVQLDSWRIASFTSLTAAHHHDSYSSNDARDIADPGRARGSLIDAMPPAHSRDDFLAFPAGRAAGIVLHELFERIDFAADGDAVRALTLELLTRERLAVDPSDARIDAVTGMAERVLTDTLPSARFALRDVPRDVTLREWAFDLPLGVIDHDTLANIFGTHGGGVSLDYAHALRRLGADRTHGFLTGVVDLVFLHEGRWYVVDWKSDHLGDDPAQYERPALEREMFASHYVLQYHLYVTALHRYLRSRLPEYSYEKDFGGVYYAFLRGIDGSGRGWFADRPSASLIDALDALMDAAPATGGLA